MQHPVQSASFSLLWSSILSYSSTISASTQRTKLIQTNSSRGKNHEQVSQDDAEFRTVCCLYELLSQCRYRIQDGTESIAEMIRAHLQQIRRLQGPALVWGEHWVAVTGVGLGRYLLDHVVFPNHSSGGGVCQQSRVRTVQIMRASAQVLQQTLRSSPILFASTSAASLLTLIWKEAGGMPRVTEAAHGRCSCVSCRASVSRMVQRLPASMRSGTTISEANTRRLHCCASLEGFLCRFLLQCFGEGDVVSPATQPASQWMGLPGNDVILAAKLTACIVAHAFTQWANLSEDLAASASLTHALAVLFSGPSSRNVFERLLHPQGLHVIPRVGLSSYQSFVTMGHCIPIEDVSHRAWWVCRRRPSSCFSASEAKGPHEGGQGGLHRDGWQLHQAAVHFVALYCSLEMDDEAIEGEGSATTGEVDRVVRWFDMLAADAFTDVSGPQSSTADRTLLFLLVVRDVVPYNTVVGLRAAAEQFQKQMVVAEQVQNELLVVSGIGQTAMHRLALDIGQLPHASLSESLKQRRSVPRCDDENSRLWSSCPAGSTVSLFEWGFDSITFFGPRTTSKQEALLQLQFSGQDHPQEECPPRHHPEATNRAEPIVVVLCGRVLSLVAPLKAMVFTQLSFLRSVFCNQPTTTATTEAGLSSSLVVAGHGSLELALCTVLSSASFAKDVRRVWWLEHEEKVDRSSSSTSPTKKEFRSSISVDELEWEATLDHVTRGLREALFTWLIVTLQQHLGLTYDNSQSRVEVALLESSSALARSFSSSPSAGTTTTLAQLYSDTVVAPTLRVADDVEAAAGGAPPVVLLADVREWIPVSQLSCLIHEAIALSADILSIGRITVRAPDLAGDTFALS